MRELDIEMARLEAENQRLTRAYTEVVGRLQTLADEHRQTVKAARQVLQVVHDRSPHTQAALARLAEFIPEPLETT